jgi:hypothetical protein
MAAASVVYKPAAETEIDDAFATYEEQRRGLGIEFLDELARIEDTFAPIRRSINVSTVICAVP